MHKTLGTNYMQCTRLILGFLLLDNGRLFCGKLHFCDKLITNLIMHTMYIVVGQSNHDLTIFFFNLCL
jgi:hypothetical protein